MYHKDHGKETFETDINRGESENKFKQWMGMYDRNQRNSTQKMSHGTCKERPDTMSHVMR